MLLPLYTLWHGSCYFLYIHFGMDHATSSIYTLAWIMHETREILVQVFIKRFSFNKKNFSRVTRTRKCAGLLDLVREQKWGGEKFNSTT
jgi:hypothetical protein